MVNEQRGSKAACKELRKDEFSGGKRENSTHHIIHSFLLSRTSLLGVLSLLFPVSSSDVYFLFDTHSELLF